MNESQTRLPIRRTADLRKGRTSLAGARYFITISAQRPERRLVLPKTAETVSGILARIEKDGDATFLASTIMPDHLHLLALLTGRLTLSRVVGKLKALTEPAMRGAGMRWQENFFEQRLRPEDRAGDYARYIFLNPYRAGLIRRNEEWPWWRRSTAYGFDFLPMLDDGRFPPAEWLQMGNEALGVMSETVGRD